MAIGDESEGGFYPTNPTVAQELQGEDGARTVQKGFIAKLSLTAAQAHALSTTGVHAAVTDTAVQVTVTTGITNPPYTRNITATSGGTSGDIKAVQVVIVGTDEAGAALTETLPVFTDNTATTVQGLKAFRTVTSITIPAHDGTGATTAIGYGDKIGLPHKLTLDTILSCFVNSIEEATAPTLTKSASVLASNHILLATALAGTAVDIFYMVP